MTEEEKNKLYADCRMMLEISKECKCFNEDASFNFDGIKICIQKMADAVIENKEEKENLLNWMENSDFYTSPASTKFHGDFEHGLAVHSFRVLLQALSMCEAYIENFTASKLNADYRLTAGDIFISTICHDFCKVNSYKIEYKNNKDIFGNWKKIPIYKSRQDSRVLGHGNESVLRVLELMPSLIKNRTVLEAISRHMGVFDLSEYESYNYSNFLKNPLVMLVQFADETASHWYNS